MGKERMNAVDVFEGKTELYVSFRVEPKRMANWPPERITQFFAGIAKMIEAAERKP